MSANSVKNHLVKGHSLMDRVTFTLEVNHVTVLCVEKSFIVSLDSEDIIKNTPKFQSNMEPEIRNESQAFAHRKMNFIEM